MLDARLCSLRACRQSRRQRVRIDFALGDVGENGVGLFLFQKTVVQQHLVTPQVKLAGKCCG